MRKLTTYFALLMCVIIMHSCTEETISDQTVEDQIIVTADLYGNNSTLSNCDFNLADIKAGSQKAISCLIDLNGKTVRLTDNVELVYDGGAIVNGTLIFKNGKIDGKLLNKDLHLEGNAKLLEPIFEFEPSRWDLVQGKTSFRNALHNRLRLEELINMVKEMSGHTFKMDQFDAYFEVTQVTHPTNPNFYPSEEAINIPADFTLIMSEKTHLRVFPNSSKKTSLLAIRNVSNATIKGGVLHGDRDEHNYSGNSSHEWGHLIDLHAAQHATVHGVKMLNATGDGMIVHSLNFTFQSNYVASHDIVITNCIFDSSRRNNLAITDGYNIVVENSEFYRAGIDTDKSKGTNPRFAIDVEAYRNRENGKLILYEKVNNVIIRNNIERESTRGGFLIAIGDNVTIENNNVATSISYRYATGAIIRNNTLRSPKKGSGTALRGGMAGTKTISNNRIYGNKVYDFGTGILLYGQENNVYDNTIINCGESIFVKDIKNSKISNNHIRSNKNGSRGIFGHFTTIENSEFVSNDIEVLGSPFNFTYVNRTSSEKDYHVLIKDNIFKSKWYYSQILNAHNLTFENNEIGTSVKIQDVGNLTFKRNKIDGSSDHYPTLHFKGNSKNVKVYHNTIIAHRTDKGTVEDSSQSKGEISEGGNTWRYMNL